MNMFVYVCIYIQMFIELILMLALHSKNIENISMFTLKLFTSNDYHLHFTLTGYRLRTAGRTSSFRIEPRGQTGWKPDPPR